MKWKGDRSFVGISTMRVDSHVRHYWTRRFSSMSSVIVGTSINTSISIHPILFLFLAHTSCNPSTQPWHLHSPPSSSPFSSLPPHKHNKSISQLLVHHHVHRVHHATRQRVRHTGSRSSRLRRRRRIGLLRVGLVRRRGLLMRRGMNS